MKTKKINKMETKKKKNNKIKWSIILSPNVINPNRQEFIVDDRILSELEDLTHIGGFLRFHIDVYSEVCSLSKTETKKVKEWLIDNILVKNVDIECLKYINKRLK